MAPLILAALLLAGCSTGCGWTWACFNAGLRSGAGEVARQGERAVDKTTPQPVRQTPFKP